MRGHAHGPFNSIDSTQTNSVLRVQKQLHLTPGDSLSVQIEASEVEPTLLRFQGYVQTAMASGTNSFLAGTAGSPDAYIGAGDITLSSLGFNTEKKFLLFAPVTMIVSLTSAEVAASGQLTISAITAANTQTVTIGAVTYTLNTSLTNTANNVLIGADVTAMAANLAAAINAGTGSGTTYGAGTVANPSVTATSALGVLTVTAKTPGTAGNSVATTETLTNSAWGAATLTGGAANSPNGSVWLFVDA